MRFKIKVGKETLEVEILETKDGVKIKVGQKEFFFEEKKEVSKVSLPKKEFEEKEILAPISGQILEVLVKEGDFVKKGQTLLLLSAMKMENEILAERDGKVKKVFVKKGQKVEKDEKLILLE